MVKRLFAAALCLLIILSLCGCSGSQGLVRVGVFEPLTGADSEGGQQELQGIQLANELYGEAAGRRVVLVTEDNMSDLSAAQSAAERLVGADRADIVLGSYGSDYALIGAEVFNGSEVPMIGATCSDVDITLNRSYCFRVCFTDDYQGRVMARCALGSLGAYRAAVIYEGGDSYSEGLRDSFIDGFEEGGGELVAEAVYGPSDTDFSAQILTVMSQQPDVIFAPGGYAQCAELIVQARELGCEAVFLGCDTWETEEFILAGGSAVEGAVFSTFYDMNLSLNSRSEEFLSAYLEAYGEEPTAAAALGFDAYLAAIGAVEAAEETGGAALREALRTLSFDGATGTISFDENGDALRSTAALKT
ncbi:MAG: ABC transporter substrate-binding protein, partial [Oscillospiraceae bacterium]|nr:ABC transporter substrate-binding protein [Oscillospiraceae bacterium]